MVVFDVVVFVVVVVLVVVEAAALATVVTALEDAAEAAAAAESAAATVAADDAAIAESAAATVVAEPSAALAEALVTAFAAVSGGVSPPPHAIERAIGMATRTGATKRRLKFRMIMGSFEGSLLTRIAETTSRNFESPLWCRRMIGRLTGIVAGEDVDGTILLDVGGVGYEILVPLGSLGRADKDEQGRTTLIIHTHVREDAFTLFGFATPTDRLVFRTLVGISGVGPKTAVGVLSALSTEELAAAIAREDTKLLTSVPGIGKKTAERLLLELRDKVAIKDIASEVKTSTKGVAKPQNSKRDILLGALVNMGYKDAQAQRAISSLGEIVDTAELPVLLRESLALLRKS